MRCAVFHVTGKTEFMSLRLDNSLVSRVPIYYSSAAPIEMANCDVLIKKTMD